MFSDGKNMESIQKLFLELKNYLKLQKKFLKLDTAEKLTVLLSAIAVIAILLLLGSMILLYLTFALAYYLGDVMGSLPLGFSVIAVFLLLVLLFFYFNRKKYIIQPIARFMANLFINSTQDENEQP